MLYHILLQPSNVCYSLVLYGILYYGTTEYCKAQYVAVDQVHDTVS